MVIPAFSLGLDFVGWLRSLTLEQFLLIFWPMIFFDLIRSLGKSFISLAYASKLRKRTQIDANALIVSIIVPAHNEEKGIVRCIESILESDYPSKEVIVVDDGSTDQTYQLAYPYYKKGLIKLLRREKPSGTKAGAVNYGLSHASGDLIVSLDADTLIERGALKEMVKSFDDPSTGAASGNIRILSGDGGSRNLLVKLQMYEYIVALELGRRFGALLGTLLIIPGAFGAFYREDVRSIGGYDHDTLTEDFDITVKLRKLKKRLVFAEKAVAWTFAPETLAAWKRQRIRWTKGQLETLWKHRDALSGKGYEKKLFLSIYDMIFSDIILLFIRFTWGLYILTQYGSNIVFIAIVIIIVYLLMEALTIASAYILSPRIEDKKIMALVPVMVLFYRPYYAFVRLQAYLDWALKKKSVW